MSSHFSVSFARAAGLAATAALALTVARAGAVDPIFDPMQSPNGPTAATPSEGARNILRQAERSPTLSERFGLPPISGSIPPPPPPQQPVLDTPGNALPPPLLAPRRARRPAPDG
jgi:hypothetical protein